MPFAIHNAPHQHPAEGKHPDYGTGKEQPQLKGGVRSIGLYGQWAPDYDRGTGSPGYGSGGFCISNHDPQRYPSQFQDAPAVRYTQPPSFEGQAGRLGYADPKFPKRHRSEVVPTRHYQAGGSKQGYVDCMQDESSSLGQPVYPMRPAAGLSEERWGSSDVRTYDHLGDGAYGRPPYDRVTLRRTWYPEGAEGYVEQGEGPHCRDQHYRVGTTREHQGLQRQEQRVPEHSSNQSGVFPGPQLPQEGFSSRRDLHTNTRSGGSLPCFGAQNSYLHQHPVGIAGRGASSDSGRAYRPVPQPSDYRGSPVGYLTQGELPGHTSVHSSNMRGRSAGFAGTSHDLLEVVRDARGDQDPEHRVSGGAKAWEGDRANLKRGWEDTWACKDQGM
jgi:hypothetical protein